MLVIRLQLAKEIQVADITQTDNFYHFTVDTNTATSGGVSGGGNSCSAGPATLERIIWQDLLTQH